MKTLLNRKEQGIALIVSIFFLIIFFAIGVTLLFRAQMGKKTSRALLNADLTKVSIESVINNVAINISNINYDSATNTLGTSPTFEGKLEEITFADGELSAHVLKSASAHTDNNADANLNNNTTKSLFKFKHNGLSYGEGTDLTPFKTGPKSEEEDIQWQLITSTGTAEDAQVGDKGYRYAFMLIDQTGKIDPNFSVASYPNIGRTATMDFNSSNFGLGWETFNNAHAAETSTPYDLSSLFTKWQRLAPKFYVENSFSDLEELYQQIEDEYYGAYTKDPLFTFFRDENNEKYEEGNAKIASNFFYPYSDQVVYAEKTGLFNLNSITTTTEIEDIYNNIPYLRDMPSEKYVDPNSAGYTYTPTAQREQATASLKDYIDDDIIATTNYKFGIDGKPWSMDDWLSETANKPYCGFEGFYIEKIVIGIPDPTSKAPNTANIGNPHNTIQNDSLSPFAGTGGNYDWVNNFKRGRINMDVFPEVKCTYDLDNTTLSSLTGGGRLMLYFEYESTAQITKHGGTPRAVFEYTVKNEVVCILPTISNKGNYFFYTKFGTSGHAPGTNWEWMNFYNVSGEGWKFERGYSTYIFSPYADEGGPGLEEGVSYTANDLQIKFTKPFILFLDDDAEGSAGHTKPELDEIVQVFALPAPKEMGLSVDVVDPDANNDVMIAYNNIDPRLGHLPSSYKLLESYDDTGWARLIRGGGYSWNWYNSFNQNRIWDIWRTVEYPELNLYPNDHLNFLPASDPIVGWPSKDEVKFTFPRYDAEMIGQTSSIADENTATDQTIIYDKANYDGIQGLDTMSTLSMSLQKDSDGNITGFGGMTNLAELGKINRGEAWRSFNLCQFNMKLHKARKDLTLDSGRVDPDPTLSSLYKYASLYDDPLDPSKEYPFNLLEPASYNDDFTNNLKISDLNGGDAEILDQVVLATDSSGNKVVTTSASYPERVVHGAYNPNTTYPYTIKALLGGIKVPRYNNQTWDYQKAINKVENQALAPWKLGALASSFNKDIQNALANKIVPFSRKYSYSHLSNSYNGSDTNPGDDSYKEDFNLIYDSSSKTFKHTDTRTGNIRYSNIFAKNDLYMLTDLEREYLYVNSREFISTRFNYYSAIILIEPLTVVPGGSVSGNPNDQQTSIRVLSTSRGLQANIHAHYRVRAEISHDTLTNTVKILDYKILN